MRINLVEDEKDNDLEIVFSKSGDILLWTEDDSASMYITDFNENEVCLGVGSIDNLITALEMVKEKIDDQ